jgi:hypothetical protein
LHTACVCVQGRMFPSCRTSRWEVRPADGGSWGVGGEKRTTGGVCCWGWQGSMRCGGSMPDSMACEGLCIEAPQTRKTRAVCDKTAGLQQVPELCRHAAPCLLSS